MMTNIILSTLNARYIHASLGLRYLYANMGALQKQTRIQEFIINSRPIDIAEQILLHKPAIIGLGVYIWNTEQTTALVKIIKTVSPETIIVLGGPEISYETEQQEIVNYADYIITHQADLAFADLCSSLLNNCKPENKIITPQLPALSDIKFPYSYFNDEDIKNRVIYVEASRGCPFKCEFCLSSLDKTAKPFDQSDFLEQLEMLYQRGVRHFKFVDRTFNLKVQASINILNFFLEKIQLSNDLFLHFELIPDHLPDQLKEAISKFPEGSLQFEIGIQSFDSQTQSLISRKQNNEKTNENVKWLRENTSAHLHTDLIVGLPGESISQFKNGFDRLVALQPHEIQVGILKRLRGTPLIRHSNVFSMNYNPDPPYNILSNNVISFSDMQVMNRFARYWDMIANSGRFKNTLPVILGSEPFDNFMSVCNWLHSNTQQTHKIALKKLFEYLYIAMKNELNINHKESLSVLTKDYNDSGLKGRFVLTDNNLETSGKEQIKTPKRQARHIA